jgi:hypothetical protein
MLRFQQTESQGNNFIFMHLAVNVGHKGIIDANSFTQITDEGIKWEKILTSCTKRHLLSFHDGDRHLSLEMTAQHDQKTESQDDILSTTTIVYTLSCSQIRPLWPKSWSPSLFTAAHQSSVYKLDDVHDIVHTICYIWVHFFTYVAYKLAFSN